MKEQAFANAFAVITAVVYVICAFWVIVARNSLMALFGSWAHGIDWKSLPYAPLTAGNLIFGFVTAVVAAWVAGWLFVWLYNRFAKG